MNALFSEIPNADFIKAHFIQRLWRHLWRHLWPFDNKMASAYFDKFMNFNLNIHSSVNVNNGYLTR